MLPKLKSFYYFHLLPEVVLGNPNLISIEDRKWRTLTDIKCLPNGLLDDIEYYRRMYAILLHISKVFSAL